MVNLRNSVIRAIINLLSFNHKCCNLIDYATRYLFRDISAEKVFGRRTLILQNNNSGMSIEVYLKVTISRDYFRFSDFSL